MKKLTYFKRKHKRALGEILGAAILFVGCTAVAHADILPTRPLPNGWPLAAFSPIPFLYLLPYLLVGHGVLRKAMRHIAHGQVFDENFLMTLATVGAFCVGEYPEAVFVMLFYRIGELFEELAVGKSRASIAALLEIRPDVAHVERCDALLTVDPAEIGVGEIIRIRPGERIPLDGIIVEGFSTLDTAALTGESLPREATEGDSIHSGCVNLTGVIRVRVTKPFGESTVSRILELVQSAGEHKSRSEQFITRFARVYTPAVVIAALLLAVLPPLSVGLFGSGFSGALWKDWSLRAMSFLVISCPCALVISVPLSFFGGIGGASRRGILVKGSGYLEALARAETVVFDKTGTLTAGCFSVTAVEPAPGYSEQALLTLAAAVERYAAHPIARALCTAADGCVDACAGAKDGLPAAEAIPASVEELAGQGLTASVHTLGGEVHRVAVGNRRLMDALGVPTPVLSDTGAGSRVFVAVDSGYAGCITVADTPKPDAAATIAALRESGVRRTVMLTGDTPAVGMEVAAALGLDDCRAGLLPADKVDALEALAAASDAHPRATLAYVGDGINDAPVLARADVGIAMGALGSDAAIEAADIVLMDDRLEALPDAIRLARKTLRIVRQNIAFALIVKAVVLLLGALGYASLWLAVFADVGVAVLAILNAMRVMK